MTNLKHVSTPFMSHYKLNDEQSPKRVEEQCYMDGPSYANIFCSIMYVMVYTHPDITYVVNIVSIFMFNPV